MKKVLPLALASFLLAGCSLMNTNTVVQVTDLMHHNFDLVSVNGSPINNGVKQGIAPSIAFGENMHISGSMCNRFFGNGTLEDGVLTAKQLAATQMLCVDEQRNQLDQVIGSVLSQGANVTLAQGTLTLATPDTTLVYQIADKL